MYLLVGSIDSIYSFFGSSIRSGWSELDFSVDSQRQGKLGAVVDCTASLVESRCPSSIWVAYLLSHECAGHFCERGVVSEAGGVPHKRTGEIHMGTQGSVHR